MKPSQVYQAMQVNYAANEPMFVWGQPGAGKSNMFAQFAKDNDLELLDWRLVLMDSVDLRGIPSVVDGKTHWNPPRELPTSGKGILFMDEFPQARIDTKNAASMLILDRKLGAYELPPGWWIAAAGNLESQRAGTSPMPTHIQNRFIHTMFDLDCADWLVWAEKADIDFRTYAYLKYRPSSLSTFDPTKKDEPAFATPRTWEYLSNALRSLEKSGYLKSWSAALLGEYLAGIVGKGVASEFVGFLTLYNSLVSIDSIERDPDGARIPDDPSVLFALSAALAEHTTREKFEKFARYINRLPGDFSYLYMSRVGKKSPVLKKTKLYTEFCIAHADFV